MRQTTGEEMEVEWVRFLVQQLVVNIYVDDERLF